MYVCVFIIQVHIQVLCKLLWRESAHAHTYMPIYRPIYECACVFDLRAGLYNFSRWVRRSCFVFYHYFKIIVLPRKNEGKCSSGHCAKKKFPGGHAPGPP